MEIVNIALNAYCSVLEIKLLKYYLLDKIDTQTNILFYYNIVRYFSAKTDTDKKKTMLYIIILKMHF